MPVVAADYIGVQSEEIRLDFTADLGVGSIETTKRDDVGRVWDLAINGVGLKVYQGESLDRDRRYRRYTLPLDPDKPRSDAPFSDSIDKYQFIGWSDFTGGAGQKHRDRTSSSVTRFLHSQGMDVFSIRGEVSLLPDTESQHDAAYSGNYLRLLQANAEMYIIERKSVYVVSHPGASPVKVWTPPTDVVSATTDGVRLFIAIAGSIWTGDKDGFKEWSHKDVDHVSWVAGGIVVSMKHGTSVTPNSFWSLGEDGLFDTQGAMAGNDSSALPLVVLPEGWHIHRAVFGGGFIWFPATGYTRSAVYRWRRAGDSVEVPVPVWDLPENELATSVFHYQGQVLVRAAVIDEDTFSMPTHMADIEQMASDTTIAARIYRCPVDQAGALVPYLLVEVEESDVQNSGGGWYALGRFVYFGWAGIDDDGERSGVGIIDLATGGWARNVVAHGNGVGMVRSIVEWRDRLYFSVDSHSVWHTVPEFVESGYIETDHSDKGTTLLKSLDDVRATFSPLPVGTSISIYPSFDYGNSYLDRGFTEDRSGAYTMVRESPMSAHSVGLRVKLTSDELTHLHTPKLKILQLRVHMQGLADQIVEIPIDCTDRQHLASGAASPSAMPGYGVATSRWLESLTQALVAVQDIDAQWTEKVEVWQIVQVETWPIVEYDDKQGKNSVAAVTRVTARRSLIQVTDLV